MREPYPSVPDYSIAIARSRDYSIVMSGNPRAE
jgi:hypothetical protein